MKVSRPGVPADTEPGVNRSRWKRLGWWLGAALPVGVALLIVSLKGLHLRDLSEEYDVSSICLLWSGGSLVAVGLAMAITAVGRGRRAWQEAEHGSTPSSRQAQLAEAYETRLRSAWMIIVGIGLSIFGGCVIWLAIAEP